MAPNPNVSDYMQTWEDQYQITHFKVPAYKAIADESIKPNLQKGQTYHRTYSSDFVVENMGGDGGYNDQAWSDADETITINFVKTVPFFVSKLNKAQYQLPVITKYARKAMNALFLQLDSDVFGAAFLGAGSVVDDGTLGGTPGNSIVVTVGNVQAIFAQADQNLRLNNVIYDPTAQYTGDFKLDRMNNMPVAIVSPQFFSILVQYLGGKTTELGDNVSNSGYVGKYFGFNLYSSNNLAWTGNLELATNPTAGDNFTLLNGITNLIGGVATPQAVTFTYVAALAAPGDILIGVNAAATLANTIAALNNPYVLSATYFPLVQTTLTPTQQKLFVGLTASALGTQLHVQANGVGNMPVAQTMTAAGNIWIAGTQTQHLIFGVTKSISVVIQYGPYFDILQANPAPGSGNSGRVGWDFVTWMNYGIKVFNDQTPQLIDVQVNTANFFTNPVNTFN